MNRTTILKGTAICSSALLMGCFVAYRQKQAGAPAAEGEPPVMPGSKNPGSARLFPSSKNIDAVLSNPGQQRTSGDFVIPADPDAPEWKKGAPEKPKTKTLLPSSKSIDSILLKPSQQKISPVPANPESPEGYVKDKTLLPSSKIGAILTPKDVEPAPEPEEKDEP